MVARKIPPMNIFDAKEERVLINEIAGSDDDPGVLDDAEEIPESQNEFQNEIARSPISYEISSYGADFDVEGLVNRLERGDIFMPDFQRRFVWTPAESSRFIESLLLGFPVPAIFLSKDTSNRFLVVDGQQRLESLKRYYNGVFGQRKFQLTGIKSEFLGKAYKELSAEVRRNLDSSLVHTIIVEQRQPLEKGSDVRSGIYLLFERLNSWGRPLFPQEIRACVDHGRFVDLLRELNKVRQWRNLYSSDGTMSKRLKDEELILRFFALYHDGKSYEAPIW